MGAEKGGRPPMRRGGLNGKIAKRSRPGSNAPTAVKSWRLKLETSELQHISMQEKQPAPNESFFIPEERIESEKSTKGLRRWIG